ncbi:metallophosphoesterase [Paenibacillus sp. TSA_86.1]|uniref:metallophosphoesterase n=1 Tax=Paenibacillus sp. TSA_86.1 TaxID=3415649 RepID=UPI004046116D
MNAKRTLVISDIHGCHAEFKQLLEIVNYNPAQDRLILIGDYVSRGPDSKKVVDLVIELVHENGAIALQGNHDQRFVRVIKNQASEKEVSKFFDKGGRETLQSYCQTNIVENSYHMKEVQDFVMDQFSHHIDFLKDLPYFYEDDEYIYVHAGLNPLVSSLSEQDPHDLLYIKEYFYTNKNPMDKIIIFGHTVTKDIHNSFDIWFGGDKIGIDGGCSFGGQLNCLELVNGKAIQNFSIKAGGHHL